jgi:hypothetical protein
MEGAQLLIETLILKLALISELEHIYDNLFNSQVSEFFP